MINTVAIIGKLMPKDDKIEQIRYLKVERVYNTLNKFTEDVISLVQWNKESKGELFTFKDDSLVAIKGRLEVFENRVVIVCEDITFLSF